MARRVDWTEELAEQLEQHWREQLRPRLDGLSDAEISLLRDLHARLG